MLQRRLTVILSADVAGYSALMQRDEAGTLARLKHIWGSVFEPRLASHGGRVIKLMGDGALIEFASVVAAVKCAHEVQTAIADLSSAQEAMLFRIGVNLGDVIVDGDDLHGEGVNVAARLQAVAAPGGIAVSRTVRDQVLGKLDLAFDDLGERPMKPGERPVHVFALGKSAVPLPSATPSDKRVSIAVLPFTNMSGDPEQEYFSDGVTEDIITDLSKVSALAVTARNSSFAYKGQSVDIIQAARRLGVGFVLEGSVRKAGARVRITAQLIDGKTGRHVWAERYDRNLNDIFALQDEISEAIVAALKLKLLPEEKRAIEQRSTNNPQAYKLFLMARQFHFIGNENQQPLVVRLCERALEIDPGYARAWAQKAMCLYDMHRVGRSDDHGRTAAERALQLDPNLPVAHAALAMVLFDESQHEASLAACKRALELDANCHEAHAQAGYASLALQRFEDAIEHYERAIAIDPGPFKPMGMVIQAYQAVGDDERARAAARRLLARIEEIIAQQPDNGQALGWGVGALAALGEAERAMEWAERALLLDPDNQNLRYNLACNFARMGKIDQALDMLETVASHRSSGVVAWMEKDTDLDPIRDHPRFKAFMAAQKPS